jgi:hypothetical protein
MWSCFMAKQMHGSQQHSDKTSKLIYAMFTTLVGTWYVYAS